MNYNLLLDMATELGYQMAMCGAETYRVEETILRVLGAYGVEAEAFSIPNCLTVSAKNDNGEPITRMRRIGPYDTNIDGIEKLNSLSRKLCSLTPDPTEAFDMIRQAVREKRKYSFPACLFGGFLGALGFCMFFGGTIPDCICSGVCGCVIFLLCSVSKKYHVNTFFSTIFAAFAMTLLAYSFNLIGFAPNAGPVIVGALMSLVPGWLFTNGMRDIIFGDTNSGTNRIVQVVMIAAALALGTGAAWKLVSSYFVLSEVAKIPVQSDLLLCVAAFIGCIGFLFTYNIHGWGSLLCALGGMLACVVYCLVYRFSESVISANFIAAVFGAIYSEIMARIRKYPAISYQVVSMFPLVPGAGIFLTTYYLVNGDMLDFSREGKQTIAIAGALAVGILSVSTCVRLWTTWKNHRNAASLPKK